MTIRKSALSRLRTPVGGVLRRASTKLAKSGFVTTCALASMAVVAYAQHQHEHEAGDPSTLGRVSFATSCTPAAQPAFEQAVAMLHSFWYEQAEKTFTDVTRVDPDCGMAYWGIAATIYRPLWYPPAAAGLKRGAELLARAKLAAKSPREKDFIGALSLFFTDSERLSHPQRAVAYANAMEQVAARYPDDREAAIFYALALNSPAVALRTDKTYAVQRKAGAILEKIFDQQPDHPGVVHYLIHSYDYPPLADRALVAARRYAKVAPAVPHALHMPSHIFTRLGIWDEAIESNIASAASANDYGVKTKMKGTWDQELHALDYLEYAYLQQGRDEAAKAVVDQVRSISKAEPENITAAYALAAIPARYAIERRQWSDAASLGPSVLRHPVGDAITAFARALGTARGGNSTAPVAEVAKIQSSRDTLIQAKDPDWPDHIEVMRRGAAAWLARAQGDSDAAVKLMRSAADLEDSVEKHPVTPGPIVPARELLGELLLDLQKPAEALAEFEAALHSAPNRFGALYGAGRAAELSGDSNTARSYYAKLVGICRADWERPELRRARAFLAKS